MQVRYGDGKTEYGPGVAIELTGNEVATAIDAYLVSHGVHVAGARTITVNGGLCQAGRVYVDPGAFAIANGRKWTGRGAAADAHQDIERASRIAELEAELAELKT